LASRASRRAAVKSRIATGCKELVYEAGRPSRSPTAEAARFVDLQRTSLARALLWLRPASGPSTAASDGTTTEGISLLIGQVELTHTLSRVAEGDADACALSVRDLSAALVGNADRLTGHFLRFGVLDHV
jgi:hypothetical protein